MLIGLLGAKTGSFRKSEIIILSFIGLSGLFFLTLLNIIESVQSLFYGILKMGRKFGNGHHEKPIKHGK